MSGFTKPSSKASGQKKPTSKPKTPRQRKNVSTKEVKVEGKELIPNILGASGAGVSDQINDKLAKPYFETGPKDDALAQDIYGRNNTNVTNKFAEAFDKKGKELLGNSKKSIRDSIKKAVKERDAGALKKGLSDIKASLDPNKLKNDLLQSVGGKQGLLNSLSDSLKGALANKYGLDPSTYEKVKVGLTEAHSAYKRGDLKSMQGVLNLANRVTDGKIDAYIEDLQGQVRTYAGLIETSVKNGLNELTEPLLESIKDKKVGKVVAAAVSEAVAEAGDMLSLSNLASKYGSGTLLKRQPKIVAKTASNYKLDLSLHASKYKSEWGKVKGQMASVDPKWDSRKRGNTKLKDVSVYATASKDLERLVKTDPKEHTRFRIAQLFPSQPVGDLMRKRYPHAMGLGSNTVSG